ncbi:PAS domain-containing protein [Marinivivus vitaminiproducens]|uniref:PAS domain-containing protein n=1 Tax=Marinivivus vitaminiproducens TaxID=3035935 RepID=UPI00279E10B7|nr:PAS domain-containing protein [Geminicoccaceae bacterium SCSIO 64248]
MHENDDAPETRNPAGAAPEHVRLDDSGDAVARDEASLAGAALPALIAYIDRERTFRFVSAAYEIWFERPRSEIMGTSVAEVFGQADFAVMAPELDKALAGEAVSFEMDLHIGGERPTQVSFTLVPDATAAGEIAGVYSTIWDVSASKRMESALSESEARCRLALDAGGMGLWMLNRAEGEATWDKRQSQLLGDVPNERRRTVEEFFSYVHPDDADDLKRRLDAPDGERIDFAHEFRVCLPNGAVRWLASRGVVAGEGGGKVTAVSYDITGQKQAEVQRQENEERFRLAIDAGRMGIWDWNLKTDLVRLEGHEAALWGWPNDVMEVPIGRFFDVVHPEDVQRVRDSVDRGDLFDRTVATEFRVLHPDGDVRWLLARGRVQCDEQGRARAMVGVHVDLTERRRIEEALRRSKERYRTTFDNMAVGMAHIGRDGAWLRVNRRLCDLLGCAHDDLLRLAMLDVVHPEDRALCQDELLPAGAGFEASGPRQVELRLVHRSGRIVWASVSVAPAVNGGEPEPEYGIAVLQDVSERKEAEDALRQSEGERRLALDAASLGTFRLDLVGSGIHCDERCRHIFGFAPEQEILADAFRQRIHVDDHERFSELLAAVARPDGDGEFDLETRITLPDRGTCWVMIRGQVVRHRDHGGKETAHLVGAVLDITERKQAEQQRERLVAELSHRVKNTLATVQSIAARTLMSSADADAFRAAFEGRIRALAQSHSLLADSRWLGAGLARLVRAEMMPYDDWRGDRLAIDGPDLMLKPRAALSLGMILHELATNAAKYGALLAPSGHVSVRWRVDADVERRLVLTWREQGGPAVVEPSHQGFGRVMIERGLMHELRGNAAMSFLPDGLHCVLTIPLAEVVADP